MCQKVTIIKLVSDTLNNIRYRSYNILISRGDTQGCEGGVGGSGNGSCAQVIRARCHSNRHIGELTQLSEDNRCQ